LIVEESLTWLPGWNQELLASGPIRVIGIDLGTTNSTVTEIVWDPTSGEEPVASLIDVPQRTTGGEITRDLVPSVVALVDGQEYVGEGAHRLRAAISNPPKRGDNIWWTTKNDIGTRRQWIGAPEGYRTPREIAARILTFLHDAAIDASERPIDRVVVTVPASFQLTQRQDTLDAAGAAGIELDGQSLLDEPVAAFLDYIARSKADLLSDRDRARVAVVDFGGGTCDVALLEASRSADGGLALARKGVSRFHRIGGSDVDEAIAANVLLPKLMEENGIAPFELGYKHKRDFVIPALASLAEQLKKKLSDLAVHQRQLGDFNPDDPNLKVTLPVPFDVNTGHPDLGVVRFQAPELKLSEWRSATKRFLNPRLLLPMEGEYFQATSIFAPISDVLSRAEWTPMHVDYVLLVGGASLDYAVGEAVSKRFPDATVLTYADPLDAQRCVGRGAAYQALLLAAFGSSPLQPTTGDELCVRTTAGPKVIVPANSKLPFPADGSWCEVEGLAMSEGAESGSVALAVEFLSGNRELHSQVQQIPAPVAKGEPIDLKVRIDENQRLMIRLEIQAAGQKQTLDVDLDNPFSVTANPNADRDRIMELEELIPIAPKAKGQKMLRELAGLHFELKEYERARQLLEGLLPTLTGAQAVNVLSELGRLCGEMGDTQAQVDYYLEAIDLGDSSSAAFNLALELRKEEPAKALELIDRRIASDASGPAHSLRGGILRNLDRENEAVESWQTAVADMSELVELTDFELSWLRYAAKGLGDDDLVARVDAERKDRESQVSSSADASSGKDGPGAALPDWVS